jgi:hypothetical protein
MSNAQRVSRGFHRLGLFLAAALFISVSAWFVALAVSVANVGSEKNTKLLCAHEYLLHGELRRLVLLEAMGLDTQGVPNEDQRVSLKVLNCSSSDYETVSYADVRNPPSFNWLGLFGPPAAIGIGIALVLSLLIHSIVRAIGWVIGGFAAS